MSGCLSLLGFAASGAANEASAIVRLNNTILGELGSAWDRPGMLVLHGRVPLKCAAEIDAIVSRRYLGDAVTALRSTYGEARRIVLDDPRVALFPGLWDAALRAEAFAPLRVLLARNPLEVTDVLHQRHQMGRPRAVQLWLRYTLSALSSDAARPEYVIGLDALQRRKAEALSDLAAALNVAQSVFAAAAPDIERIIRDNLPEPPLPPDVLDRKPLVSALVKDTYLLCREWQSREPATRREAAAGLAARFEEYCLIAGALATVGAAALAPAGVALDAAPAAPAVRSGANGRRPVIIHYHLFKNAGTSVDAILKRNFGQGWASQEYPQRSAPVMIAEAGTYLLQHPQVMALSSHTLMLPLPEVPGVDIFPIIFVRHPLDRLKSAYVFERDQRAETAGARLAKETDFAGYLRARLANPADRACRNFHTARLAMAEPADGSTEFERALRAFEHLPFVGSVEAFDASVEMLQRLVTPLFPGFRAFAAFENVSRPQKSLEARIAEIREELGGALFQTLVAHNADDLMLYRRAVARYRDDPSLARREMPHEAPTETLTQMPQRAAAAP